jgi:hypothetical protein
MNSKSDSHDWAAMVARNTVRLGVWTAAWVATMALATFGPIFLWSDGRMSLLAILVNLAIGFGMIMAHKRYLQGLDEMQQKIQLEAMGVSLGVGLVVGLAYSNLDLANVIASDAEIGVLVLLMGLTYSASAIAGCLRYR